LCKEGAVRLEALTAALTEAVIGFCVATPCSLWTDTGVPEEHAATIFRVIDIMTFDARFIYMS
jgi:hypothetical protein